MTGRERDDLLIRLDEKVGAMHETLVSLAPKVEDHESTLRWIKLGVGGALTAIGGLVVNFIHEKFMGK